MLQPSLESATCDFSGGGCPTVVVMSQAVLFYWFLLVRNVARLLVERNVAPVWVCGGCMVCVVKESSPLHDENG